MTTAEKPRPDNRLCVLCREVMPVEEKGSGCINNKAHVLDRVPGRTFEEFVAQEGLEPDF